MQPVEDGSWDEDGGSLCRRRFIYRLGVVGVVWMAVRACGQDLGQKGIILTEGQYNRVVPAIMGMNILKELDQLLFNKEGPDYWKQTANDRPTQKVFQHLIRTSGLRRNGGNQYPVGKIRVPRRTKITLPPKRETVLTLSVGAHRKLDDIEVLVEPIFLDEDRVDPLVARTLATVRDGRVPLRCVNTSDQALTLTPGVVLGHVYLAPEEVASTETIELKPIEGEAWALSVSLEEREDPTEQWNSRIILEQMGADLTPFTPVEAKTIENFIRENQATFSRHEEDFRCTDKIQHEIPTGEAPPSRERYRQIPSKYYQEVKELLAQMLKSGVIRESQSPWAAPIVLVKKKDGSTRFCVDYRKLNSCTIRDSYPVPRIEESLTALGKARYFSSLDLASGYWQVPVAEKDKAKTAFIVPMGLFEFNRMPFGLSNAPGTFQRLMESCLGDMNFEATLIYLDDIVVYSASFTQHLDQLGQVFRCLRGHGLKLKPKKCRIFQREIEYLGHKVSEAGIQPSDDKVRAVQQWPTPTTLREVRAFLGLAGHCRRFIKHFAKLAEPLHKLLRATARGPKTQRINWGPRQAEAMDKIKEALTSAPILAYADYNLPFRLYTDASLYGLGAVLSQVQEGVERVIAYGSRTLRETECNPVNYSSFRLELLALVWAITERFAEYLAGARIEVYTDNNPLAHITTAKLGAMEQRWIARLSKYDYHVQYCSKHENQNADALSRVTSEVPVGEIDEQLEEDEIPDFRKFTSKVVEAWILEIATGTSSRLLGQSREEWIKVQSSDPELVRVREWVTQQRKPSKKIQEELSHETLQILSQWEKLSMQEGLLYRRVYLAAELEERWQVVIPQKMALPLAQEAHEKGAHFGPDKTTGRGIEELNLTPPGDSESQSVGSWIDCHRRRLETVHRIATKRLQEKKHLPQKPAQEVPFQPGDKVLVAEKRPQHKLSERWEVEPYIVVRRTFPHGPVYEVKNE
ncbi:uncharacterized protein LOC142201168 [Leptodactylus fuscus]|uniref:uncharacterized protein LOC142201168 n=1 Tax=Leptodactylus fuscus TaxID=238119 RepID=UPI003F4E4735